MGKSYQDMQYYLNTCRIKRNKSDYDTAGLISPNDARELIDTVKKLFDDIKKWLRDNYPQYI